MRLYDTSDLEEAMTAIKEEVMKDLSESVTMENRSNDKTIDTLDFN